MNFDDLLKATIDCNTWTSLYHSEMTKKISLEKYQIVGVIEDISIVEIKLFLGSNPKDGCHYNANVRFNDDKELFQELLQFKKGQKVSLTMIVDSFNKPGGYTNYISYRGRLDGNNIQLL